jgi:hypothetical protein
MAIPFTQYLRPDGRRAQVEIDMPEEIERKAQQIIAAGYVFEVEHLTTGHASLTIADPSKGEDVAIEVVPNGPAVPDAVERLVRSFNPETDAIDYDEGTDG